jgi:flagellar protein FliO/FliZ
MFCLLALIATEIETVPATPSTAVDFTWLFIKMLFVLAAVTIVAILVLKYGVPRTAFYKRFSRGSLVNILSKQHIAPRKALYLVEIGGRYMLLGVTDHAITPVLELSAQEAGRMAGGGIDADGGGKA